ncbi:oligosaccharide flippase family protein [Clostridium sp. C8-1-8]|uniref:oligosaccharide flippase family protein n=1 Tax=Clostridium sp. C8-1-8 TaxID=2698831 RepID=UPI0013720B8A|nr:oligosaccharide flippase family protein [Clostridium sp. C8-1-8]
MASKNSITKNIFYKSLLTIFNMIIPLIIGPYASRIIGPTYMGRVYFSESIYTYFLIFATFGIYNYGLREISRIRDDKEKSSKLFTSLFVIGMLSNLLVIIAYLIFVFIKFSSQPQFLVLLIYGFTLFSNVFYVEWMCEATESYRFITIKTMIIRSIYVIFLLILVRNPTDYIKYAALNSLLTFINYLASFLYIKRAISFNFSELDLKKHLKPLFIIVIMSNASILFTQLDKILLGSYVGETSVGYYNTSQMLGSMINYLLLSIVLVSIPRLSNVLASQGRDAYEYLLNKIARTYLLLLLPASIGALVLSKEIILLLFGIKFAQSIPVLQVFSIYMIATGLDYLLVNSIFYVHRREKLAMLLVTLLGLLNFILKIILIKINLLDHVSAIFTTTISTWILVIAEYTVIKLKLKVKVSLLTFDKFKYLVISLLFIPITLIIKLYLHKFILIILASIIINSTLYAVILLLTKDEVVLDILIKLKLIKHN